ncbi:hypothetical protein ACTND3_11725 [Bacillota bacterium HCP28S3_F12]
MGLKQKIRSSFWSVSAILLLSGCTSMAQKTEELDPIGWETVPSSGSEADSTQEHYEEADKSSSESAEEIGTSDLGIEAASTAESIPLDSANASAYETMIHNIRSYVQNWSPDTIDFDHYEDYFPSENVTMYTPGYVIEDIDGDGIEELILTITCDEPIIYAIYTTVDGEAIPILQQGFVRNAYALCEDGMIENLGSSGAAYTSYSYYKIADHKLVLVESVFTNPMDSEGHMASEDAGATSVGWFYSTSEPYDPEAKMITESEADEITGSYKKVELNPILIE